MWGLIVLGLRVRAVRETPRARALPAQSATAAPEPAPGGAVGPGPSTSDRARPVQRPISLTGRYFPISVRAPAIAARPAPFAPAASTVVQSK